MTIEKYNLIANGDSVLVACSGGPDSVCLLYVLNELKSKYCLTLHIAHLNHCLRESAYSDAIFVKELAKKLNCECTIEEIDVRKYRGASLEEKCREARYDFLFSVANKFSMNKIAVGHTLSDDIETFFHRIARGTGLHGLLLIPPKRGKIIRPLIEVEREEIIKFLNENKISYRIDETNYDVNSPRNYIRLEIIPRLMKLANDLPQKILRMKENITCDELYLEKLAENLFNEVILSKNEYGIEIDLNKLLSSDICLIRRIIRRLFEYEYPSFNCIENIIKYIKGKSTAGKLKFNNLTFIKSCGKLLVTKHDLPTINEKELSIPCEVIVNGNKIMCKVVDRCVKFNDNIAYFDLQRLNLPLFVRSWQLGDKITCSYGTAKLSDIFIDNKVPSWRRNSIPIICDKNGILWVVSLKRSNRAIVTNETKKILEIKVENEG